MMIGLNTEFIALFFFSRLVQGSWRRTAVLRVHVQTLYGKVEYLGI